MKQSFLNSLSFFILGALVTTSGYFLYLNLQKNSASKISEQKEVVIKVHSFEELPKDEQAKYVRKDELANSKDSRRLIDQYAQEIDDLEKELRDAQMQSMQNSRIAATRITELQNEVDSLKEQLGRADTDATAVSDKPIASKSEFERIRANLQAEIKGAKAEISKLKDENGKLKDTINLKESELKRVVSEQEAAVLKAKNLNQDELNKLKSDLEAKKEDFEKIIKQKDDEILAIKKDADLANEKLKKLSDDYQEKTNDTKDRLRKISEENAKFKAQNDELNSQMENVKAKFEKEKSNLEKDILSMSSLYKNEVERLKMELERSVSESSALKNELEATVKDLSEQNIKKSEQLEADESNITYLKEQLRETSERLEEEILNNKKDIKNYKILNDKITLLIQSNIQIDKDAKEQVANAQKAMQEYKKISDEFDEKIAKKDSQIKELSDKFEEFKQNFKSQIEAKNEENSRLIKEAKELKNLAAIGKNHVAIKNELEQTKKQIAQVLEDSEYLSNENENLRKIIQLNFKSEVPKKVVFIASVECDDMGVGSDKPTITCINKVTEFLQKYNSNYYFEITPIVSQGNFIATSKIAKLVPKNELERINTYANFGIGRERAKTAGNLIRDEFGDFSRISYSSEIITSSTKQGFVIKVYR
ncbi:hypothetical protein [Campylobacter sp. RM16188]|uniref:hypothetical protein n=1 Tax=Campylobacter sp. RM16188 TaxID=1705725 RepID=UPI0015545EE0|nr:hypothetical protein [Campylobacter sp. RM16188]